MDSFPQEIIDEIIDDLPLSSLRSSSLVSKRWRKRSQQRAFSSITFSSEYDVNGWHISTRGALGGVLPYVQLARFSNITEWADPALFGRVLQNLSSLTTLWTYGTEIPDETLEYISREHGENITELHFWSPRCSLSTMTSMIIAFPNLRNLVIDTIMSTDEPPIHSVLPQRKRLDSLRVAECKEEVTQALANLRLVSRSLTLDVQTWNIQKLLIFSSPIVAELVLLGVCSLFEDDKSINNDIAQDYPDQSTFRHLDLPPFPALTSLEIQVSGRTPSSHLINTLSSISSARTLASVTLDCWWRPPFEFDRSDIWDNLDRWLVQMAENTMAEDGLELILVRWQEDEISEDFLPMFKEVGKITIDN